LAWILQPVLLLTAHLTKEAFLRSAHRIDFIWPQTSAPPADDGASFDPASLLALDWAGVSSARGQTRRMLSTCISTWGCMAPRQTTASANKRLRSLPKHSLK
jgi:hypothetical protein